MPAIKCKMCGGDLDVSEGLSVCQCEYCGTKQTVPSADNEKKLSLFSRANRLRIANEFDKAAGVYESIVADFPEEAEAYWGLVLCKYGIEYVDDPATGKKVPTCHRSSFDSVMEDSDFEQACENADSIARRQYREEAKQIEEIRRGIIEVSGKEAPYDIFICYKETDENGERTIDSVLAQDVYDALDEKGYRVFFSRISLEDKIGTEYEPYIFAALNSARVMLVFGTDYEYFNAVWVKNEWSRFLKLMTADKSKYLIPCFKDLDAYDMPKEFHRLQAQDMGKVGAMQDLIRGVEKLLPKDQEEARTVQQTVVTQSADSIKGEAALKRGWLALEDGEWDRANQFFEDALSFNAENAAAYLGKVCAFCNAKTLIELSERNPNILENKDYQKARRFADNELSKRLADIEAEQYRNEEKRRRQLAEIETEQARKDKEDNNILFPVRKRLEQAHGIFSTYFNNNGIVGLKTDGTVIADGLSFISANFSDWRDIVAVSTGGKHTVGLKADGSVIAEGKIGKAEDKGQRNVSDWADIIAVSAGEEHTVGLKADGSVIAVGSNKWGQCNVSSWRDIVAVYAGMIDTYGLKADGSVVVANNAINNALDYHQNDISGWRDIVAVSRGFMHTVGLKANGTPVVIGDNKYGQCGISGWKHIVGISAGPFHTAGLKADGTVIAVGLNDHGQCDVSGWRDIVAISTGHQFTVGLQADGSLVATGDSKSRRWDVSKWKLFNNFDTLAEERAEAKRRAEEKSAALQAQSVALQAECSALQSELADLKGLFTGKRRKELENKIAEIQARMNQLQSES